MKLPGLTRLYVGIVTAAIALGVSAVQAVTIEVCGDGSGDHLTIQAGIDAAGPGDEVVICPGIYTGSGNRDLDYHGKSITVRGEAGAASTIIDCQGTMLAPHRGVQFKSAEQAGSLLRDVSIINGYGPRESVVSYPEPVGGAVYCGPNTAPTLIACVFEDNTAGMFGGAVYCAAGSDPTLDGCVVRGNRAEGDFVDGGGGGIYCDDESGPTIVDCLIENNTTGDGLGGGVHCDFYCVATIERCVIRGNQSPWGGGVFCGSGRPRIVNCGLYGNTAEHGGAIGVGSYSWPTITNSTIAHNTASDYGGGIDCINCISKMTNTILWDNTAPQGAQISLRSGASHTISWCDVEGGQAAVYVSASTLNWGAGNIQADPQFADPDGPDDNPDTLSNNDYHLTPASPCIDAADNLADIDDAHPGADPLPGTDLDSRPRFVDVPFVADTGQGTAPIVDIGAYELGPAPADFDEDWDVDQDDAGHFQMCLTGQGQGPPAAGCEPADIQGDGDVDADDYALFEGCSSAPGVMADPGCLN
jgi:predicted outer membrane repeat protein